MPVAHSFGGFVTIRALLSFPDLAQRVGDVVLFATWAGRVLDGAPPNRLRIPLAEHVVLQQRRWEKTVGVLPGAAQCGSRPSLAMVAAFDDSFSQHLDQHGPLTPTV